MHHPVLEDLMSYLDDELPPSARSRVEVHVNECGECQQKMRRLSATAAEIAAIHTLTSGNDPDPLADQRARLQARLHPAAPQAQTPRRSVAAWARTLAYAATLLIVAGTGWFFVSVRTKTGNQSLALPNPAYTPGAVRQVTLNELCAASDDEVVRDVPSSMEQAVFREYGLGHAKLGDYEVDHLITPGLGGSDEVANLWPQPHSSQWNSFVKDQLEDHLHHMVCRGQLPLAAAQHDIASNWIAAYKKYFHTEEPLRASDAVVPVQRLALLR